MATLSDPITDVVRGDAFPLGDRGITNLDTTLASASLALRRHRDETAPPVFSDTSGGGSTITVSNAGVRQTNGTYTAQVTVFVSAADTSRLTAGVTYYLFIHVTEVDGDPFTSEIIPIIPLA